jgi:hypothetical protein
MSPEEVRAWFGDLTRRHMSEPLLGRYRIELVDHDAWLASFDAAKGEVFPGDANMDITRAWSDAQRQRFDELNSVFGVPLQHNVVLHDLERDDAVVGWAYGVQDQRATWYMARRASARCSAGTRPTTTACSSPSCARASSSRPSS